MAGAQIVGLGCCVVLAMVSMRFASSALADDAQKGNMKFNFQSPFRDECLKWRPNDNISNSDGPRDFELHPGHNVIQKNWGQCDIFVLKDGIIFRVAYYDHAQVEVFTNQIFSDLLKDRENLWGTPSLRESHFELEKKDLSDTKTPLNRDIGSAEWLVPPSLIRLFSVIYNRKKKIITLIDENYEYKLGKLYELQFRMLGSPREKSR